MCYPLIFGIFITAANIYNDPAMHDLGGRQVLVHYLDSIRQLEYLDISHLC
jgi:hypothetical protein